MIKKLEKFIVGWLQSNDLLPSESNYFADWIMFAIGLIVAYGIFYGVRWLLVFIIKKIVKKTKSRLHQSLIDKKFYTRIALIPALIIVNVLIDTLFESHISTQETLSTCSSIVGVILFCSILFSFLNALDATYSYTQYAKQGSIKGIVQAIKTVLYIIVIIFIICLLFNVPMKTLLTVLGGTSAVFMLVFKDSILGLVSGIQLSVNKMILPGDWIEMPQSHADGTVIDISQITVKVQNWDNTITTIPAYDLISKPVINWRGMSDSGVRRIKRSVYIDMTSVKFCTDEMLERFRKIEYLSSYIDDKESDIQKDNNENHASSSEMSVNGRKESNLGIFRAYLQRYLEHHPMVSHDSILMVRQLQSTNLGIPIEVYVFTKTTVWTEYENIQSDIFEHIISVVPYFDLLLFQNPSWNDYRMKNMPLKSIEEEQMNNE